MYLLDPGDLDDVEFKDRLYVVVISLLTSEQANSLRLPVLQYRTRTTQSQLLLQRLQGAGCRVESMADSRRAGRVLEIVSSFARYSVPLSPSPSTALDQLEAATAVW